jgi:choline dehydrogenase-like flavoprotein
MSLKVSLNYGHPCGTCRAGDDPATSVLDRNCKAHGIDNLYIVDSSFMPTSGGTNPSLTIAANALRVADNIAKQLD